MKAKMILAAALVAVLMSTGAKAGGSGITPVRQAPHRVAMEEPVPPIAPPCNSNFCGKIFLPLITR